jgi:hypothetical protein
MWFYTSKSQLAFFYIYSNNTNLKVTQKVLKVAGKTIAPDKGSLNQDQNMVALRD